MRMTSLEKFLISSPLRIYIQRKFEAPDVLSALNVEQGSTVLEIGCGHGAGTLMVNQYLDCKRVVGIDIDPDMIKAARKYIMNPPRWARGIKTGNIELSYQDARFLAFFDDCFEAVLVFGVFEHIIEWKRVIPEVYRVLKTGGIFSFEEFLLGESGNNRFGHVTFSEGELEDALVSSGFSIRSFEIKKRIPRCLVRAVKNSGSRVKEMSE